MLKMSWFTALLVAVTITRSGGNIYPGSGNGISSGGAYQQGFPPSSSGGFPPSQPGQTPSMQMTPFGQQQHLIQQQNSASHISFREIDDMDREVVLQYVLDVLRKAVVENDTLRKRQGQSSTRLAGDDKLFYDDIDAHIVAEPLAAREDCNKRSSTSAATLQSLFEKLSVPSFRIRNLTIVIALSYMDKVANILHMYATSRTVRRLFGGCLIIASKMHQNEVSREELADAMGLSIGDLVNIESAIVLSIRDLTVHPQALANYVRPLMAAHPSATVNSPPTMHSSYNPMTQNPSLFPGQQQYQQQYQQQQYQQQPSSPPPSPYQNQSPSQPPPRY